MKLLGVREAKQDLSACVEESQDEGIIITKHGKPAAVLIGVAGQSLEDVMLMANPRFWEMIEARRAQPRTSFDDFERELGKEGKKRTRKAG
jgi:prevent-host-death family protein